MSEFIKVNGKYYLIDERSYDKVYLVNSSGPNIIPNPDHPEWTYTYGSPSFPYRNHNAGFPPESSVIYDIKTGLSGDLELNKDWDVSFDNSPGMNVKFRWQYRVDNGKPTTDVGMA